MPRRKKTDMVTYYRLVHAEEREDAEQEGLAMVLRAILPDTMDQWRVASKQMRPLPKDKSPIWDVRVDFHRVKHPEYGKPVEEVVTKKGPKSRL